MSRILKNWHSVIDPNDVVTIESKVPGLSPIDTDSDDTTDIEQQPTIDLEAIQQQADKIIATAKQTAQVEADAIINQANETATNIKNTAAEEAARDAEIQKNNAYEQGYSDAITKAKNEAADIVDQAEEIKHQAQLYREELIANIEPDVINLITSVLDNLIEIEKDLNPNLISVIIRNGLNTTSAIDGILVHVSTEDYPNVDKKTIVSSLDTMATIDFVEDPTLKKSACIIETPLGNIDCGLDTQYNSLRKNLHYILKNR